MVAVDLGDYAEAKAYYEQALALFRQLGNRLGEARSLGSLGMVARSKETHAGAKAFLEQSAQLYQQIEVPIPTSVQSALDG